MLLLVDVGNTNTVIGAAESSSDRPLASWRVASVRDRMPDEWAALLAELTRASGLALDRFTGAIVASVVPAITRHLAQALRERAGLDPLLVSAGLDLGITLAVDTPAEVGADRLVNAAFAYHAYGGPTIVIDLGTATKIEAITAAGAYLGGVIAPGLGLTLDALASRAARLFAVELTAPPAAIGRNTVHAVQSGIVLGHAAMIEGMLARVRAEIGGANHIILTGGYAGAIGSLCPSVTDTRLELTLAGLAYLWRRNRPVSA